MFFEPHFFFFSKRHDVIEMKLDKKIYVEVFWHLYGRLPKKGITITIINIH